MPTSDELKILQELPLELKIKRTQQRIREFVDHFGVDGVYVSFSGGKDSTALLHIVRQLYPDTRGVFSDTGLEYPEIREFVKTFKNIDWIKPKLRFKEVVKKYGYPFISKEVSKDVHYARTHRRLVEEKGIGTEEENAHYQKLFSLGKYENSMFGNKRWSFLYDAPFECGDGCCKAMKKRPFAQYHKETGRVPITAQMACESLLRKQNWIRHGCNIFDGNAQKSNPLSFWTDQDVLMYLYKNKIPIASVYGEIIRKKEWDDQLDIYDLGVEGAECGELITTGVNRTGCMFCAYGAHCEKPGQGRFELMKKTHPKQYEYIMRPEEEDGMNYREIIDWINEHNGKGEIIRY